MGWEGCSQCYWLFVVNIIIGNKAIYVFMDIVEFGSSSNLSMLLNGSCRTISLVVQCSLVLATHYHSKLIHKLTNSAPSIATRPPKQLCLVASLLTLIFLSPGLSNCSWSSCREGCTRDIFSCHHILVEYTFLQVTIIMSLNRSYPPL